MNYLPNESNHPQNTGSDILVANLRLDIQSLRVEFGEHLSEISKRLAHISSDLAGQIKPLLTVSEVADLTDRCEDTVRRWIRNGCLPAHKALGTGPRGRWLVKREDLDRVLEGGLGGDISPVVVRVGDSNAA